MQSQNHHHHQEEEDEEATDFANLRRIVHSIANKTDQQIADELEGAAPSGFLDVTWACRSACVSRQAKAFLDELILESKAETATAASASASSSSSQNSSNEEKQLQQEKKENQEIRKFESAEADDDDDISNKNKNNKNKINQKRLNIAKNLFELNEDGAGNVSLTKSFFHDEDGNNNDDLAGFRNDSAVDYDFVFENPEDEQQQLDQEDEHVRNRMRLLGGFRSSSSHDRRLYDENSSQFIKFPFGFFTVKKLLVPPRIAYHTFIKVSFPTTTTTTEEEQGDDSTKKKKRDFLLIFGGVNNSTHFNTLLLLDVLTLDWYLVIQRGDSPPSRRSHCMARLHNSRSLPTQFRPFVNPSLESFLSDMKTLAKRNKDETNIQQQLVVAATLAREYHSAERDSDMVVLFGGFTDNATYLDTTHVLCVATMTWRKIEALTGDLPLALTGSFVFSLPASNRIVVFGGNHRETRVNVMYVLDADLMRWTRYVDPKDKNKYKNHRPTVRQNDDADDDDEEDDDEEEEEEEEEEEDDEDEEEDEEEEEEENDDELDRVDEDMPEFQEIDGEQHDLPEEDDNDEDEELDDDGMNGDLIDNGMTDILENHEEENQVVIASTAFNNSNSHNNNNNVSGPSSSSASNSARTSKKRVRNSIIRQVDKNFLSGSQLLAQQQQEAQEKQQQPQPQKKLQLGDVPSPRSSSLILPLTDTKFILFGGWKASPDEFYNDVYIFESDSFTWKKIDCTGDIPEGRSGHYGCILLNKMIVYGGFTNNFRNEMYSLDLITFRWERLYPRGSEFGLFGIQNAAPHFKPKSTSSTTQKSAAQSNLINKQIVAQSNEWNTISPSRSGHIMAEVGTDKVLVFGGYSGSMFTRSLLILKISSNFRKEIRNLFDPIN